MTEAQTTRSGGDKWLALEGGREASGRREPHRSRFAAIGACIPAPRLTTDELMATTRYETGIELERLTGVRERHVVAEGEDSSTLALGAARDALAHAQCQADDSTC